ncbi:Protein R01E6.7, partial [Aphelenchoides avenae]
MATVEAATPSTSECTLHKAEMCFLKLFHSMPICDESEVSFRCHHYKVLDACFRETDTVCSPSVIGHTAKAAYRRTLIACARHSGKRYRNAPRRGKTSPTIRRQSPPSEIQFISLFGYLQTQCNTKPHENCTNSEYTEMVTHCETGIREKSHLANSDLDRHQLLRVKLDASSRLLQYAETRRDDECLVSAHARSSNYRTTLDGQISVDGHLPDPSEVLFPDDCHEVHVQPAKLREPLRGQLHRPGSQESAVRPTSV